MDISVHSYNSFQGYDARRLKGFIMSSNFHGLADEMAKIGEKEGFKIHNVFFENFMLVCSRQPCADIKKFGSIWAQDYWTIVNNTLISYNKDDRAAKIREVFGLKSNLVQEIKRGSPKYKKLYNKLKFNNQHNYSEIAIYNDDILKMNQFDCNTHISGGNIFIVKDGGEDAVIVGENELENFTVEEIKDMYGVKKVTILPQMDYHLDLFMRPLDNKRILLADDNMTLKILQYMTKLVPKVLFRKENMKLNDVIVDFKSSITKNDFPQFSETEKILTDNGYEVIKVPGRIYQTCEYYNGEDPFLVQKCNYMNANVLLNNQGELVYITNKSNLDKEIGLDREVFRRLGISFEQIFKQYLSPYVSPEHIYFVEGDKCVVPRLLSNSQGGVHCICSEVP